MALRNRFVAWLLVATVLTLGLAITAAAGAAGDRPQKVTISFWHAFGGGRMTFIQRMVDDFNFTHPEIEVQVEFKGTYRETLNAAILAARQGKAPHVVQIFEVGSQLALDSGIFVPVADLLQPGDFPTEDYIAPLLNYYTIGGRINSLPWNSSSPILYYNKDALRRAGWDPESPPSTFQQVLEASRRVVQSRVAPAGITWPLHSWFFEQWMAEQGALLANNENGRAARATETHLTSEAAVRIVRWWKEMSDLGYYVYSGKLEDWDGANQIFLSGQVPMLITSTSDVTFMRQAAAEQGFELGTGFLPIPDGTERNGVVIGGASLWLTRGHPDRELQAAKTFALWMSNTENALRWHKGTGYYPIRHSAISVLQMERWFERYPQYRAAFDQLLQTKLNRATQGALLGPFPEVRTIIEEAVQKVLAGRASVESALAEAKTRADQAVARYNRTVGR